MKMNAKNLAALLPLSVVAAAPAPQASDRVVEIFTELSEVPRYSGNEARIGDWLMYWANAQGFNPTRDTAGRGNVIFDVPATEGRGNTSLLVLQVHQDMVRATKEGVKHDWEDDSIIVDETDGWLRSMNNETSLGADDGIDLAKTLAAIGNETEYDLVSFKGGSAKNAIPTFATVVISPPLKRRLWRSRTAWFG